MAYAPFKWNDDSMFLTSVGNYWIYVLQCKQHAGATCMSNLPPYPMQSLLWNTKKYMSQCIDGSSFYQKFLEIAPAQEEKRKSFVFYCDI